MSGSAQWIDYTSAFGRLTFLERRVLQVVINHGPVDRYDGDPGGRLANGKYATGTDGTHFDDPEVFWRHYAHTVGSYDWQTLADTEEMAYRHMARRMRQTARKGRPGCGSSWQKPGASPLTTQQRRWRRVSSPALMTRV